MLNGVTIKSDRYRIMVDKNSKLAKYHEVLSNLADHFVFRLLACTTLVGEQFPAI